VRSYARRNAISWLLGVPPADLRSPDPFTVFFFFFCLPFFLSFSFYFIVLCARLIKHTATDVARRQIITVIIYSHYHLCICEHTILWCTGTANFVRPPDFQPQVGRDPNRHTQFCRSQNRSDTARSSLTLCYTVGTMPAHVCDRYYHSMATVSVARRPWYIVIQWNLPIAGVLLGTYYELSTILCISSHYYNIYIGTYIIIFVWLKVVRVDCFAGISSAAEYTIDRKKGTAAGLSENFNRLQSSKQ